MIDGKSPLQLAGKSKGQPFRLLDMACGSGSFLLGAYQFLLDYCLKWYTENGPKKFKQAVWKPNGNGAWGLTIGERKRILTTHIFGVDIDAQAVEVSKLTLLLKVLEGETDESLGRQTQLRLFEERALPNLDQNIRCGNSLVGSDGFTDRLIVDEEELKKMNPFDWNAEFPAVFQAGGFDAVIGNPPYVDSEWMETYLKSTRNYCVSRYTAASGNWDLFCVFAEKALRLCRNRGAASLIVPNKLGSAEYAAGARRVLASENRLVGIRDYSTVRVFPVAVYPIVFHSIKEPPEPQGHTVAYERMEMQETGAITIAGQRDLPYERFFSHPDQPWEVFGGAETSALIEKMRTCPELQSVATVLGAATVSEAYEMQELISESGKTDHGTVRFVNSGTIDRYGNLWAHKKLRYLGKSYTRPVIADEKLERLPAKRRSQAAAKKIIVAGMTKRLECIADLEGNILAAKSTSIVLSTLDLSFLLGILNSQAVSYFYSMVFGGNRLQGGYLRIGPPQLRKIPIPLVDLADKLTKKRHDRLISLVGQIVALSTSLGETDSEKGRGILQRQINATDAEIDRTVYDLYGLTPQEIKLVEGG
jgi:hypothetical protein